MCIFLENDIQIVKKTKEYKTVICALIQKKIEEDTVTKATGDRGLERDTEKRREREGKSLCLFFHRE